MAKTSSATSAFNAAYDAGTVKSVTASHFPFIGGNRAQFYKNTDSDGGWLVATVSTGPASNRTECVQITDAVVNEADAVDFDPYNNGAYAQALLAISDRVRKAL
jgi:predicted fused transcriptional regulator/phosphomethylpyrimidine kinase